MIMRMHAGAPSPPAPHLPMPAGTTSFPLAGSCANCQKDETAEPNFKINRCGKCKLIRFVGCYYLMEVYTNLSRHIQILQVNIFVTITLRCSLLIHALALTARRQTGIGTKRRVSGLELPSILTDEWGRQMPDLQDRHGREVGELVAARAKYYI